MNDKEKLGKALAHLKKFIDGIAYVIATFWPTFPNSKIARTRG